MERCESEKSDARTRYIGGIGLCALRRLTAFHSSAPVNPWREAGCGARECLIFLRLFISVCSFTDRVGDFLIFLELVGIAIELAGRAVGIYDKEAAHEE